MNTSTTEQIGFFFDAPLERIPASQVPPPPPKPVLPENDAFVAKLRALLPDLPDDICVDDLLLAAGLPRESLIHWHRARALDALLTLPPVYQAYDADPDPANPRLIRKMRFRRLPPMELCPGFEDETCTVLTRGGVRCVRHLDMEEEALWNQD